MSIFGFIQNKIQEKKAERIGISPQKFKEYKQKRAKETFLKQQEEERKQEERLYKERARIKTDRKLARYKNRRGISLTALRNAIPKPTKELFGSSSSGPQFGLDNKKESPFEIKVKK